MKKLLLVFICFLFVSPAYALTGISFGIKGGINFNADLGGAETIADIDNMTLIGGQIKVATIPMVDFIGTVEYSWGKADVLSGIGEFKVHDLALTASIVYPIKLNVVKPYAGLGVGTHAMAYSIEVEGVSLPPIPADKSYFGYHLLGGFDISFPTFPVSLTVEARMNWIKTVGDKSKYFQITGGINFGL